MSYEVETHQTTTTTSSEGIGLDKSYPRTIPAFLKIAEVVLCLITFICASSNLYFSCCLGGGWVQFVSMSALITTLLFFLFHLFRVFTKLPGPWIFIEFVYYVVYVVLYLIAFIVCAVRSGQYGHSAIVATTVFCVITLIVYGVDLFFQFRGWQDSRHHGGGGGTTTQSSTTTTTHSTYETRTQY